MVMSQSGIDAINIGAGRFPWRIGTGSMPCSAVVKVHVSGMILPFEDAPADQALRSLGGSATRRPRVPGWPAENDRSVAERVSQGRSRDRRTASGGGRQGTVT